MILKLLIIIGLVASGVCQKQKQQLQPSCLQEGDPIRIHMLIMNESGQVVATYNFPLIYSLKQPQQSAHLNVTLYPQMGNITIQAQLWCETRNKMLSRSIKQLTRYGRIRGASSSTVAMEMDIGISEKVDENTKYGLQIPARYKMLALYLVNPIPFTYEHFRLFGFTLFLQKNNKQCYAPPVDLSQMHIPFKTYRSISNHINTTRQHQILFLAEVYSLTSYQFFYGFTNIELMKQINPLAAELYTQDTIDLIKQTLFDNNFYLVLFYFALNIIQTFMQFFAFKNEIKVWKSIEKNAGLSIKALYQNLVCSVIVCLYLHDKQANRLFFLFQIIDLIMVCWKITRAIKVSVSWSNRFIIKFQYKQWYHNHRKVQTADTQAFHYTNYLIIVLYSLFMIYKLYPVAQSAYAYYEKDQFPPLPRVKQIYSFFLQVSVMFIFVLGFVMMTPQLYINYKLKSVDHLPWKTLIYRFISTIIDDIFVFMIQLPWLQRMFSFRDDIIFVLYLIQRRIYKVDKNRVALGVGSIDLNSIQQKQIGDEEHSKKQ